MCSCHCSKSANADVQCTMMVIIAERIHLFPFRTQQLSSHTSTIFGWRRPEKIDRCHQPDENSFNYGFFFLLLVSSQMKKGLPQSKCFEGKRNNRAKKLFTLYMSFKINLIKLQIFDTNFNNMCYTNMQIID